jgi:hypothetical protein
MFWNVKGRNFSAATVDAWGPSTERPQSPSDEAGQIISSFTFEVGGTDGNQSVA